MKKILKYLIILGLLQANAEASSEPPTTHIVEPADNLEMIRVEPGSYKFANKYDVTITKPFYLGKYEVTQSEWKKVNGSIPAETQEIGDNHPVQGVSWYMAIEWCTKLNEIEKKAGKLSPNWKYSLPTQAEWEYACRAGTTTRYYWGNEPDSTKSNNDNRIGHAIAVGSYKPNPWGFYDMYGNVWEYTRDSKGPNYKVPRGIDPTNTRGVRSMVRGGGWYSRGDSNIEIKHSLGHGPKKQETGRNWGDRGFRLALLKIEEGTDNPYGEKKPAPDATPPKTGPGDAPDLKCKETIAKLEQEIKNQKIEITDLNTLIIELRKQVADLNSSNLALTTEVSGLKNQVSNLNGQVTSLTSENGELKGQVTNLKEDNSNLQTKVATLTEQLGEAERIAKVPFVYDWIYTQDHGWLYINPDNFPIIYKNDTQSWHFYEQGSINPRYFYNFKEQKWEAWDPIPKGSEN